MLNTFIFFLIILSCMLPSFLLYHAPCSTPCMLMLARMAACSSEGHIWYMFALYIIHPHTPDLQYQVYLHAHCMSVVYHTLIYTYRIRVPTQEQTSILCIMFRTQISILWDVICTVHYLQDLGTHSGKLSILCIISGIWVLALGIYLSYSLSLGLGFPIWAVIYSIRVPTNSWQLIILCIISRSYIHTLGTCIYCALHREPSPGRHIHYTSSVYPLRGRHPFWT